MITWILKNWSWTSFALGAGAIVYGSTAGRPALVRAVKTGLDIGDFASGSFQQAKTELAKIKQEATQLQASTTAAPHGISDLVTEFQKLREEIATLKSNLGQA
jgi:hypothetical protein